MKRTLGVKSEVLLIMKRDDIKVDMDMFEL